LESARPHGKGILIRFVGINDPETVGLLRNELVYKAAANLPKLPADEYYYHDLLGMQVFLEDGQKLGVLQEIIETGANDVYRVETGNGKEVLLPAIESVIIDINTDEGCMIVRLQEWL
jgi:16S rRNA processing protein RimM